MAIVPADMTKCTKKERCLSGSNSGLAYDPETPCANGDFNPLTCDCEVTNCGFNCSATIKWKVRFNTFTTGCVPSVTTCTEFGGNQYSTVVTNFTKGSDFEFITVPTGQTGTCSGTANTTAGIRYKSCQNGVPTVETLTLGAPGCSVNTSAGSIAEVFDVQVVEGTCSGYVASTSTLTDKTYDCLTCTGSLVSSTTGAPATTYIAVTESDYNTAYFDCSNINSTCETSCIIRTAGGKAWHDAGWDVVTNCIPTGGGPGIGNTFTCPNNVTNPCNAYNRPDLRYYSASGRLYEAPALIGQKPPGT